MCAFRSARPPRCGRVVVDVPVLFRRHRAGFHALLRVEYNSRFPCAAFAGAPRSCTHEHDKERERERYVFLYRCSIELSSVLYIAKKD
jgi:hypothetical protein